MLAKETLGLFIPTETEDFEPLSDEFTSAFIEEFYRQSGKEDEETLKYIFDLQVRIARGFENTSSWSSRYESVGEIMELEDSEKKMSALIVLGAEKFGIQPLEFLMYVKENIKRIHRKRRLVIQKIVTEIKRLLTKEAGEVLEKRALFLDRVMGVLVREQEMKNDTNRFILAVDKVVKDNETTEFRIKTTTEFIRMAQLLLNDEILEKEKEPA